MAEFTITIPDGKVDLLFDSIASQKGWEEEPEDWGPEHPEWDPNKVWMNKLQFAEHWLYSTLKAIVRQEMQQNAREANQAALDAEMAQWENP